MSFDDLLNENVLPGDDDDQYGGGDDDEGGYKPEVDDGVRIKVDPKSQIKTRTVRNPRLRLTEQTLTGKRGLHTIETYFKDVKFKGKGHEKSDLDDILKNLQHWAHRMYPTYKFEDALNRVEQLGKKKTLHVYMNKYRLNLLEPDIVPDKDDDMAADNADDIDEPFDEIDAILGEQIAMSRLAPKTPNHNKTTMSVCSSVNTPKFNAGGNVFSTPNSNRNVDDSFSGIAPLPDEHATPSVSKPKLSAEQLERIAENRRLALERLKAKKLQESIH